METQTIRRNFIKYFEKEGHTVVASSSVIPHDDPTLLFINAGMNQFKDVFLGKTRRDYTRAVTSQKCIRVGGKHNDLDNVGHTSRHLTFFEMLGNFSFGDYFKKEAIRFAWEVSTEVFGFDPDYLWPTVFRDDDEAFELWTSYVPAKKITRFDEKENFWAMGDTGPCGPCSELLYDRGPKYGEGSNPLEDPDGERYLEFWNLVFMQYNRSTGGEMAPLPKPSIDTGGGLERIVGLKMGVESVFETDVLRHLIEGVEKATGKTYDRKNHDTAPAFHVIADHLRTLAFAIADGAQPSNVDRGYVLRKVLRRAVRYGRTLGRQEPFLAKVLPALLETMGPDYPELKDSADRIGEILTVEEEAFMRTLRRGGNILNQVIEDSVKHGRQISGDDAFKLKDTYGFPLEEILLLAKDQELTVNLERFDSLEKEARERSRQAHKVTHQEIDEGVFAPIAEKQGASKFLGYETTRAKGKIVALIVDGETVTEMAEGQEGMVLLDATPFYAEKGGQVGDKGILEGTKNQSFLVTDCVEPYKGLVGHEGKVRKGPLKVGQEVTAAVDAERRQQIANNHTATHLLHWALQEVLGPHVKQAGSVVDDQRLRFDFSHHKALTPEEIRQIEDMVNEKIRENCAVKAYEIPYSDAQKDPKIMQFFGDKYDRVVRVIDLDYSKELCGGTHTSSVGNIGYFRIAKEGSIAAGVRRIEAVTGSKAEALAREPIEQLESLASKLKTLPNKLPQRIEQLINDQKALEQQLKEMKTGHLGQIIQELKGKMVMIGDIPILAEEIPLSAGDLKDLADAFMESLNSGVVVLASGEGGKCSLIARVSEDLVGKGIKANEIIKEIAPIVNGGGGGKANAAQAGGKTPEKIPEALAKTKELLSVQC